MINILTNLCTDSGGYKIFGLLGVILDIIKIIVPIIIVIMGSIDLVKAVIAQREEDLKKGYSTLIKRVIIGVIIFFLPGLVGVIISWVGATQNCESAECVFKNGSECIEKGNELAKFASLKKIDEQIEQIKNSNKTYEEKLKLIEELKKEREILKKDLLKNSDNIDEYENIEKSCAPGQDRKYGTCVDIEYYYGG